ncbi:MAG: M20 family metallopeptidase [Spirochaetia bacterium]
MGTADIKISEEVRASADEIIRLRRHFHQNPETAFREVKTSSKIAEYLQNLGIKVKRGYAETGLTALVEGSGEGPTVMYRADMDALPVQENNPHLDFRSRNAGISHACGHDAHMAVALGAAKIVNQNRKNLRGSVLFVFQPSEEAAPGGAERMIEEGALDSPVPDTVLGMHVWQDFPVGRIAVSPGPVFASTDEFTVTVTGSGGHGALPHKTTDTISCAARIALALQEIPSREINPLTPFVLSLGQIHGGSAYNIIPGKAEIQGTIRCFDKETREFAKERIREISEGIASTFRCGCGLSFWDGYPALVNDPETTAILRQTVKEIFPDRNIITDYRTMGSEDFAYYLEKAPGCFFLIGSRNDSKGLTASHHSADFDIDEDALSFGLQTAVSGIRRFTRSVF